MTYPSATTSARIKIITTATPMYTTHGDEESVPASYALRRSAASRAALAKSPLGEVPRGTPALASVFLSTNVACRSCRGAFAGAEE